MEDPGQGNCDPNILCKSSIFSIKKCAMAHILTLHEVLLHEASTRHHQVSGNLDPQPLPLIVPLSDLVLSLLSGWRLF